MRLTDKLKNFFSGAATALEIMPQEEGCPQLGKYLPQSISEALTSDWQKITGDLNVAIRKCTQNYSA